MKYAFWGIVVTILLSVFFIPLTFNQEASDEKDEYISELESCLEENNDYTNELEYQLNAIKQIFDNIPYPADYYDFVEAYDESYRHTEIQYSRPDCYAE